ncbi:ATP-binding cassette domain-containing protein [Bacteroides heparinolyticus]|uniref:ATP-binding cassette domain-containing protein n=1 Tax=Prevotella heparinolytica TaxID=28113 RepID=A0A3P2ABA6_9BACE|nr:ATP-binding cassette domain-containing protein [Bacteroides heparinolyticus]RRD91986.1 ATP-binding cassette domain-containing protein [Bacteroides heparinolyticus]
MKKMLLNNVIVRYRDNNDIILNIPSLEINSGLNFLIGKNGSGKSTLLKTISNNEDIEFNGDICIDGKYLCRKKIGIVSQNPSKSITPELTFYENMLQASLKGKEFFSTHLASSRRLKKKVVDFLLSFNLEIDIQSLLDKEAEKLSIGQQQLLAIFMRLYRNSSVLLLDECTASLDMNNTKMVMDILQSIAMGETIILFVTHQIDLLETPNTRVLEAKNSNILYKR